MKLVFIHGPAASGKLTIARALGQRTGFAVFHNHLVVDAVAAVFPFGSDSFVKLRERMWLDTMREAAVTGRSLIFTFAPEPTVAVDFPQRAAEAVAAAGGSTCFVRLTVSRAEQEKRIDAASRAEFGKLRSLALLRQLRDDFEACERRMPAGALAIDTGAVQPQQAADEIARALAL
jgi:hypothetical protein